MDEEIVRRAWLDPSTLGYVGRVFDTVGSVPVFECGVCSFIFDAGRMDVRVEADGGVGDVCPYRCPLCEVEELRSRLSLLGAAAEQTVEASDPEELAMGLATLHEVLDDA